MWRAWTVVERKEGQALTSGRPCWQMSSAVEASWLRLSQRGLLPPQGREMLRVDANKLPSQEKQWEGVCLVACFLVVSSGLWPEPYGDGGSAGGALSSLSFSGFSVLWSRTQQALGPDGRTCAGVLYPEQSSTVLGWLISLSHSSLPPVWLLVTASPV